jgi:hypothetical protein
MCHFAYKIGKLAHRQKDAKHKLHIAYGAWCHQRGWVVRKGDGVLRDRHFTVVPRLAVTCPVGATRPQHRECPLETQSRIYCVSCADKGK